MMRAVKPQSRSLCPDWLTVRYLLLIPLLLCVTTVQAAAENGLSKTSSLDARQSVIGGESVLGIVLSLILVVALIFIMAWFMRRMGGAGFRSSSFLKIVGGVSMGARERIVLVQVGEEQLLIGVAPGRIQTLHKLEKPLQTSESRDSAVPGFSERLKTILNKEK